MLKAYITKEELSKNNALWHYLTYFEKEQSKPEVSNNKGNNKLNSRNQQNENRQTNKTRESEQRYNFILGKYQEIEQPLTRLLKIKRKRAKTTISGMKEALLLQIL